MLIDRNTPTPLYVQLKALIKGKIESSELPPGMRLPSERELCDEYNVSRTTVRETLRELEQEGLIQTIPGRGTFIAHPRLGLSVNVSMDGFTRDISREGVAPSSILLDASLVESPKQDVIERLNLQPHDEVVKIERLRLVNNIPLALHTAYLVHNLCPNILQHNLAQESLFEILGEKYALYPMRAEEEAYAALADPREMKLLRLTFPSAVLHTERITYLQNGTVIELSRATYCGDWYRFRVKLNTNDTINTSQQTLSVNERNLS